MLITIRLHASLAGLSPADRTLELPEGSLVSDAMRRLGLPGGVEAVVLLDRKPAGPDTPLSRGGVLEFLPVVDGG